MSTIGGGEEKERQVGTDSEQSLYIPKKKKKIEIEERLRF
jgi:hypothetical protein